jgi:Zn-dependent protease with chaperone function
MQQRWVRKMTGWRRWLSLGLLSLLIVLTTPHWVLAQAPNPTRQQGSAADLKTPTPAPAPSAKPMPQPTASPAAGSTVNPTANPTATPPTNPSPAVSPSIPPPGTSPTSIEPGQRRRPQLSAPRTPAAKPFDGTAGASFDPRVAEADRLWLAGQRTEAVALYRQVKPPFGVSTTAALIAAPITDPVQLPPGAQVFWREAEAGTQSNLYTAIKVPLELLVEQYPQFIPGHLRLAAFLESQKDFKGAQTVIEKALVLYPSQPDLVRAMLDIHIRDKKWIEASLAARQFAVFNPDHPRAAEFNTIAAQYMQKFQSELRGQIRENAITSAVTGLLGVAVTGSPLASLNTVQSMIPLLQGETAVGNGVVRGIKRQAELVEDPLVVNYVNTMGQKLAALAGRQEFTYEFYVLADDTLNAFALPGGKIFVSSGAITRARSEAELAGLLGHEIAHAVLSHSFLRLTQGTAIANITQLLPNQTVGQVASAATISRYSRDMEREADVLGTRILAKSGYAADGLFNLSRTLEALERGRPTPAAWLASHPATPERVRYLQGLIQRHNYNRYAFEGVEQHQKVKDKITQLMRDYFDQPPGARRRQQKQKPSAQPTPQASPQPSPQPTGQPSVQPVPSSPQSSPSP